MRWSKQNVMIQRIQSLYLFVATVLVALAAVFPLLLFQLEDQDVQLRAFLWETVLAEGETQQLHTLWSLGISFCITALLDFVIIFFYKKRRFQIKLTHYAFILKIALCVVIAYFAYIVNVENVVSIKPRVGILLILISMVFDWLAVKAIRKDENLVRSIDRIR